MKQEEKKSAPFIPLSCVPAIIHPVRTGDGQHGAVGEGLADGALNQHVGIQVHAGGGLVHHQDRLLALFGLFLLVSRTNRGEKVLYRKNTTIEIDKKEGAPGPAAARAPCRKADAGPEVRSADVF